MTARPRSGYRDVGVAIRAAHLRLTRRRNHGLRTLERRVLDAVIDTVATYSRLQDRVAITQIARYVYDVAEPKGWQCQRVQEALRKLRDADIVVYEMPLGRPRVGVERYATVGLPLAETHPGAALDSEQKYIPDSRQKHPEFARKAPDTYGDTEKNSEKNPEEASTHNFEREVREYYGDVVDADEIDRLLQITSRYLRDAFADAVRNHERYPSFLRRRVRELEAAAAPRPAYLQHVTECPVCGNLTFDCPGHNDEGAVV